MDYFSFANFVEGHISMECLDFLAKAILKLKLIDMRRIKNQMQAHEMPKCSAEFRKTGQNVFYSNHNFSYRLSVSESLRKTITLLDLAHQHSKERIFTKYHFFHERGIQSSDLKSNRS